jgi:pimeloyl-ACP methyl ester carboxylesterase
MHTPEKIAIVLLPGMDGTGELLRTLAEKLSTHRPVQIIGYPVDRFLSYDLLVSCVRDRLPNDRFVVLGESFSGPIAIEIAATDPRVVGLVLASSFAWHPLPTQLTVFTRLLDLRWIPTSVVVAALMGSAATPQLRVHLRQVLATLPREIIRARAQDVLRVDKRGRLREIKCPVLCLHGRSDLLKPFPIIWKHSSALSWPGLSRPPRSCGTAAPHYRDRRDKPGDDTLRCAADSK